MLDNPNVLDGLVQRRIPWLKTKVVFKNCIKPGNAADLFELETLDNVLHISGSSVSAMGMGLNHYLKYYCKRSLSHCGDNISEPEDIPVITKKVIISTPFQYRYALNYCTYNYSMSFWKWEQWERELDWMVLNGVNLMLLATGTKAVWKKVLEKLNYTRKEINRFLPGPVYNAWWLMGNLEGWGGNTSDTFIDQQVLLTRKIISRMRSFEIEPVYHGFYGIVPRSFKEKFHDAPVIDQGKWNGVFERPSLLVCSSPLFRKTAGIYYDAVKKLFGDFKFFGGDPFHEGGSTEGLNVSEEAASIQQAMQDAVPGSVWVLQAWYSNPKQAILDGLKNKELALIIDLFGEVTKEWEERDGFSNTPFVWCSVNNFGEKTGMFGRLEKIAAGPKEALNSKYGPLVKGLGAIPEGILNNPVVYDMIFESAWDPEKFQVKQWLENYVAYRYGTTSKKLNEAWNILYQTAYSSPDNYQEGASESIFCARPSLHVTSAGTWATRTLYYNTSLFQHAASLFLDAAPDVAYTETYKYDLIDIIRQAISNEGQHLYDQLVKAFNQCNKKQFAVYKDGFLKLILTLDELLGANPAFMLGRWLKEAKQFRKSKEERDLCEWNARVLVSYWGPDNKDTTLRDYANKEWAGLLKDYYYPRWKYFLDTLQWQLNGFELPMVNFFSFEKNWSEQKNVYPSGAQRDTLKAAKTAMDKLERIQHATRKVVHH